MANVSEQILLQDHGPCTVRELKALNISLLSEIEKKVLKSRGRSTPNLALSQDSFCKGIYKVLLIVLSESLI